MIFIAHPSLVLLFWVLVALPQQSTVFVLAQPVSPILRGGTYCEVIWAGPLNTSTAAPGGDDGSGTPRITTATVSWNGTGGACPANPGFFNLTKDDIRQVHGENADLVIWNGMRQWTLDYFLPQQELLQGGDETAVGNYSVEQQDERQDVFYEYGHDIFPDGSGLRMRQQATLELNTSTGVSGLAMMPFTPRPVTRNVTAVWLKDTTVYELLSPDCTKIYVMQAIMLGRPGNWGIQLEDLPLLEQNLTLPNDEWTFRRRILYEDLYIYGNDGVTMVLQDNLRNSYSAVDEIDIEWLCDIEIDADGNVEDNGSGNNGKDRNNKDKESSSSGGGRSQLSVLSLIFILFFLEMVVPI